MNIDDNLYDIYQSNQIFNERRRVQKNIRQDLENNKVNTHHLIFNSNLFHICTWDQQLARSGDSQINELHRT